jgi:PhoD-like phosphatase
LKAIAEKSLEENNNPSYTMIGDNIDILETAFKKSKKAGKPWQIWASSTMLGPNKAINFARATEVIKDPSVKTGVKEYFDAVLRGNTSGFFRTLVAMDKFDVPWNIDDFNGFAHERAAILDMVQANTNNPIILGGDLHDSWAWKLYDKGAMQGKAVAVNLGGPGVTSPGWGPFVGGVLNPISNLLGGDEGVFKFLNDMWELQNNGLVYGDVQKKGFFAVKATKDSHVAEYFLVTQNTTLSNFAEARAWNNGKITAAFSCDASLLTRAAIPGELTPQASCSAIKFDSKRPSVWSLPVPIRPLIKGKKLIDCGMDSCVTRLKKGASKNSKNEKKNKKK